MRCRGDDKGEGKGFSNNLTVSRTKDCRVICSCGMKALLARDDGSGMVCTAAELGCLSRSLSSIIASARIFRSRGGGGGDDGSSFRRRILASNKANKLPMGRDTVPEGRRPKRERFRPTRGKTFSSDAVAPDDNALVELPPRLFLGRVFMVFGKLHKTSIGQWCCAVLCVNDGVVEMLLVLLLVPSNHNREDLLALALLVDVR